MDCAASDISDESLISAIRAGNNAAFAQLVGKYKRRVFGLAARFARDNDELEDICQNVFIKIYENLSSFRNDAPFEHWLTRVAVRTCHDALRDRRHEKNNLRLDDRAYELQDNAEKARDDARLARDFLKSALSRLTPDERLVITLLELEGFSVREIAAVTDWSEANVKVRAHRARQALKRVVEDYDERQGR
jgi:RNA polymerase sigma-70 factor (ECF subfamily)